MRRSMSGRLLVVALTTLLIAAGCGKDEAKSDSSATTVADGSTPPATAESFVDPTKDCLADFNPTAGIEGDTIKVGTIGPKTGAITVTIYDRVTKGLKAYFKHVNDTGGVKAGDGKTYKLELEEGDDSYDANKTPAVAKDLVESKKVFAMVGSIGTETNLAVRSYLNEQCVPSVALGTGSPEWGKNADSRWYIGGLPSYATEAVRFLDYYKTVKPDAKIALLYQSDDFGKSYQTAIKQFITDNGGTMSLAAEASFDPKSGQTTQASVTELAQSKADLLFVGLSGSSCAGSLPFVPADWTPDRYLSITCSGKLALSFGKDKVEGIYTSQATLDPGSASDATDPAMVAYLADAVAAGISAEDVSDGVHAAGWGFGSIFVRALEKSPEMTRDSVMNTLWSLQDEQIGLIRPGNTVNTDNDKDPWLIEGLRIVQRAGTDWTEVAPLLAYEGKSNGFAGN